MGASKVLPPITQFQITPIDTNNPPRTDILGFYVCSTAPINVEDPLTGALDPFSQEHSVGVDATRQTIQKIAEYLSVSDDPQVVISIHGYGTQRRDAETRYHRIYRYATNVCQPKTSVFFGYCWPSEKPSGDTSIKTGEPPVPDSFSVKLKYAFQALPTLLFQLFFSGLLLILGSIVLLISSAFLKVISFAIFVISIAFVFAVTTLILLRLSTYFRDNYRATNYGVLDLVELIRQLDYEIVQKNCSKKVKLSFIGHSMGCFIVTNTVRILSDVFDPNSISQEPTSNIGNVFCLERLVLIAPDIPVETVVPRRGNFLRSSLRRCKEAYIFASEGDLAVRLASTAANYFSFPGRTRFSGYRLGNLTAKRFKDQSDRLKRTLAPEDFGVVNFNRDRTDLEPPYEWLEIRSSHQEHKLLSEIRNWGQIEKEHLQFVQDAPVSDLFTYFDCTDYVDLQDRPDGSQTEISQGVVTYGLRKTALSLRDYVSLCFAYFLGWPRRINTHGGYFDGVFSQTLIYKLAFLGFSGLLASMEKDACITEVQRPDLLSRQKLLELLSQQAQEKGIQIVLAPVRYQQNVIDTKQ